jgi:hypothetical protein
MSVLLTIFAAIYNFHYEGDTGSFFNELNNTDM